MKTKFVDKGIPVIIGEYGAFRKKVLAPSDQELHNASIEYFYRYFVKSATDMGIITYCWDTGGLFDFTTGKIKDKVVVNAIIRGGTDTIPVTNVSINENIDSLTVGATTSLTATVLPLDATYKTVTWRSIDPSVATVSPAGLVTGLKAGKTIIYADADLKHAAVSIIVYDNSTSVTQATKLVDIAIFPNPLNRKLLTIDLGELKGKTTIQFIEINGQTVLEQAVYDKQCTQLDVNLIPGIYIIKFSNNEKTVLKKLVIN
jgi:hypothetical protein